MSDIFCTYGGDREEAIVAYLYEDGPALERAAFEAHVALCETCREELEGFRAVRGRLARWAPPAVLERSAAAAVHAGAPPRDGGALAVAGAPGGDAPRSWWRDVPAWAQAVAAVFVLGAAAGAANLDVRYDQTGFSVRTGWMKPPAAVATSEPPASAQTPWQADLAKVEDELRAEMRASQPQTVSVAGRAAPADAETMRRVRMLIEESETRQQNELALRIAQVVRDVQAQRAADLTKIDRTLGVIQSNTGFEVARQREMLQTLAVRVSQTR